MCAEEVQNLVRIALLSNNRVRVVYNNDGVKWVVNAKIQIYPKNAHNSIPVVSRLCKSSMKWQIVKALPVSKAAP